MRIFYRRSGKRISRALVRTARINHAQGWRIGIGPAGVRRYPNEPLAKRFEKMTEEEFCRETGAFTYK